jgi:uncharacterized membrane protein (UPF0127 family)
MSLGSGSLDDLLAPLATPEGLRWLRRGVWGLGALGVLVALLVGANGPADPHLLSSAAVAATKAHSRPSLVAGFNQVGFRVIRAARGGPGRAECALLADTAARQLQGMTGRTDLDGYDAMLLRYPQDTTAPLFNRGLRISLSVAWFDGSGVYIDQATMPAGGAVRAFAPEVDGIETSYRYAVEVPAGRLASLGIGPHTELLVGGGC